MKKVKTRSRQNVPPEGGRDIAERIVVSAMKLFGGTSHYYVSLREISADAGVTLSLTIYYFKNKENLYRIAFERTMTRLDDFFRKLARHLDHNPRLNRKEAAGLFQDCVGTTFDAVYGNKNNENPCGKILLYELACPTPYHEEFLEKYFRPHFELVARLIMRIDQTMPYESAFHRGIAFFGEILSLMVQRELIAKTLGTTVIGPKEIKRFRKMVVDHSMEMIRDTR